jgi:dihydroorotate dehydrogenase
LVNSLKKPWLLMPVKLAHDMLPYILPALSVLYKKELPPWHSYSWKHLNFRNPMGIAGGVDKNAKNISAWCGLGAGFIEVGTVTPLAQNPNPGKIIDRNPNQLALWNKMGFPSQGVKDTLKEIKKHSSKVSVPIFANIGKNRDTPNDQAHEDYIKLLEAMHSHVDGFVVNISSPNTKDLRVLLEPANLSRFLNPIITKHRNLDQNENHQVKPILLKLSPNMEKEDLLSAIDTSLKLGFDGWILTNTTAKYEENLGFGNQGGGVSGKPLAERSKEILRDVVAHLPAHVRKEKIIISSGGILSKDDILERLDMGANLVQVYSALIFQGPWFFQQVAQN